MIPQQYLNPRNVQLLLDYAKQEINRALSERRQLEERWLKYQRMYKGIPDQDVKQFPFLGAANLVLPIGAIDTDTIFSRLIGILFGPENLWSVRPLREDAVEYAPAVQEFLQWAQGAELGAYNAVADWLLEMCKLGTGVLKERYRRETRLVYEFREMPGGTVEKISRQRTQDNPVLEHVSLYDFLVPSGTIDNQQAPWNAERVMITPSQLEARAKAGIYTGIDRLRSWGANRDRGSWIREEIDRMQMFHSGLPNKIELWEFWTNFDLGFGEPMPIVCTLHLPTMTYLRVDFNPFFHQEYPFSVGRYLRQEKQFYGIGIMELQEQFQDEGTAMHNQRIDNNTLANSVMMKGKKGIGLKDDEPIFPGRWFLVDNMEDVQTLQFGRGFDSTVQDEQLMLSYGARRTGVNDYVMGNNTANIGYAAAQTNIMQHQEAAKRFDQTLRESRQALGGSGRRVSELYQQFNPGGKIFTVMGPQDGALVTKFLQFPLELIRHSVAIDVTATSASLNKEVQIRTNTILMQLVTQFYQQAMQGIQIAINPQVPPELQKVAYHSVQSGSILMKRLLALYNEQDVDKLIPGMEDIIGQGAQQLGQFGIGTGGLWAQPPGFQAGPGTGGYAQGSLSAPGLRMVAQ